MPGRRFVKGGGNDLALDAPLHIRNFLRSFVDEEDHERHFLVIGGDAPGDILEEHRLSRPGRRDDQAPLSLADGGKEVHDPGGKIVGIQLEIQLVLRIQRREIVEEDLVPGCVGQFMVNRIDLEEGEIFFPLLGRPHLAGNGIAGPQIEATDL